MDLQAVVLELATGATRYSHTDYRGNVKLVSDDAGDIVAHYAYAAYGVKSLVGSDPAAPCCSAPASTTPSPLSEWLRPAVE